MYPTMPSHTQWWAQWVWPPHSPPKPHLTLDLSILQCNYENGVLGTIASMQALQTYTDHLLLPTISTLLIVPTTYTCCRSPQPFHHLDPPLPTISTPDWLDIPPAWPTLGHLSIIECQTRALGFLFGFGFILFVEYHLFTLCFGNIYIL